MLTMKTKLIAMIAWLASLSAVAQSTVLEQYIREGLKSNLQLQQERLSYERSVENLSLAKALFLPYASVNASYQLANGGRKIVLPVGDLVNPVYATLNQLTGTNKFPQISNETVNFLATNFHDTKVRVIQPLNTEIYFNYKAQKELVSVQQAQKNAYENQLKFEIASAYYQHLQTRDGVRILESTQRTLKELFTVNQSLVANAKATRDVVLSTEYELDKIAQQLAEARRNFDVSKAYFNFLLNRELSSNIEVDSLITLPAANPEDVSSLTKTALAQRQELLQAHYGLQANQHLISMARGNALLPKFSVVGDVGYQGTNYTFGSDQQYWLMQFGLTWDLFKGGERRTRVQQARIDYQIMENKMEQLRRQIEWQVIQAHGDVEAGREALRASQAGVNSAERSFQIISAKYREGAALLIEFLDAQNKVTTSRLTHSINQFELLRRTAALQRTINNL